MKLELKHLVPYLPYRLKCYEPRFNTQHTIIGLVNDEVYIGDEDEIFSFVLDNETLAILRPLSDLTKEIEVNGEKFVPLDWLRKNIDEKLQFSEMGFYDYEVKGLINKLHYSLFDVFQYEIELSEIIKLTQKLFEWHFDIFGLIEKGLAIDINTLNK